MNNSGYIVVTRPAKENIELSRKLRELGGQVLSYPTIKIQKNTFDKKALEDFKQSDWVFFTSKNGVNYFLDNVDVKILKKKRIAVVGPKTAEELKKSDIKVNFIPSKFTTKCLGEEVPINKSQKVFLPRAQIATPSLKRILERRGAKVYDIAIYKTVYRTDSTERLKNFLLDNKVRLITFTSPSTVEGFIKSLNKETINKALTCRTIVIGPVTRKKARAVGFKNVTMADTFTTEGLIEKFQIMQQKNAIS